MRRAALSTGACGWVAYSAGTNQLSSGHGREALDFPVGTPLAEIELRVIKETLKHTKGDKSLAAQLLGISTRTIYRKLDEAGPADSNLGGES